MMTMCGVIIAWTWRSSSLVNFNYCMMACHIAGNNELDQIQKIHAIMGTPPPELLAKLKKRSCHSSSFDFPACEGSGLAKLLGHVHPDCADLISKLLAYNPDERLSARQVRRIG